MVRRPRSDPDPLVADLEKLRSLRWGNTADIAQDLTVLLDDEVIAKAGSFPADRLKRVAALAKLLDRMLLGIKKREEATPPPSNRSLWLAGSLLLRRHKGTFQGETLADADVSLLYDVIESKWQLMRDSGRAKKGDPLGPGTFREHHQKPVYQQLAFELRTLVGLPTDHSSIRGPTLPPEQPSGTDPDVPESHQPPTASPDSRPVGVPTPTVAHNIPPGTYLQYIPRVQQTQVQHDLNGDLPITTIVGIGGVGKSSLARDIAHRIATETLHMPFSAIVWCSDKPSPGSTTLGTLLDQLADVIDFPGLKSMSAADRAARATQLCREHAILFVVDNANSIEDAALLDWLRTIPDPSRVLLTSREELPHFADLSAVVPLQGFDADQARAFAAQVLTKVGAPVATQLPPDFLRDLTAVTGGNARAIEVAVGLLINAGRPIGAILDSFAAAKPDLFADLFQQCWMSLDASARSALFAMQLMPFGVSAAHLADILTIDSDNLGHALASLKGLALLDLTWTEDSVLLYRLDPLLGAFIVSHREEHLKDVTAIEDRCVALLRTVVADVGFCPEDVSRLRTLDSPALRRNIESTVRWCTERHRWDDVIALTRDVRYYYYVRGIWSPDPNPNLQRAAAARHSGNARDECDALLYYCNIAAKQENFRALSEHLPRISELLEASPSDDPSRPAFRHVEALAALARGDTDHAISLWQTNLSGPLTEADRSANRRWLGVAYYRLGSLDIARSIFRDAVEHDLELGFARAVLASRLYLIRIALSSLSGDTTTVDSAQIRSSDLDLSALEDDVRDLNDLLYTAEWLELRGNAAKLLGDTRRSIEYFELAAAHFDKLGAASRKHRVTIELSTLQTTLDYS